MTMLQDLITRTLADPLSAAQAHAAGGGRVVGLFGPELPIELVLAAGAFPLMLPAGARRPTPDAGRYLESSFSPAARLLLQDWIDGRLDRMEAVIFSRASDNAQRLYYYICELRRRGLLGGPEPLLYDLAKIERETSSGRSIAATRALAERLGATDLAEAVARMDRRRALFGRVAAARPAWPGSAVERLLRAAGFADFDTFDAALVDALDEAAAEPAGPRLLLVGTAPPDERLHRAVETAGGQIAAELHENGLDRHGPAIGDSDDPITAIASRYQALPFGSRSFADRPRLLAEAAARASADGVIFWLIEEEEALVWDLPAQVRAAEALDLPHLALTRTTWEAGQGDLDRISHFTATIGGAR